MPVVMHQKRRRARDAYGTISEHIIQRPRASHLCGGCGHVIAGRHWRLYGGYGQPPYVLRLCLACKPEATDGKR